MSVEVKDPFQWFETKREAMNFWVSYTVYSIFEIIFIFFLTIKVADILCRKLGKQQSTKQK